ncbi:U-box domain-containing protein 34 isoform X1 [Tanacetum coccineum]
MVPLLGACPERGRLIYEYMENEILEEYVSKKKTKYYLSWPTRFRIAFEVACALAFLHNSKPDPIVHRDLKPGNILLDRNFVSKIGDVGMAKLITDVVPDNLIDTAEDFVSDDIWFWVVQFVTNNEDLLPYATLKVREYLDKPAIHEKVSAYLLGEYNHLLAKRPGCRPKEIFSIIHEKLPDVSTQLDHNGVHRPEERSQALCLKDSRVLYEDPYVHIGIKAEWRDHQGRFVLFLGNKNTPPLSSVQAVILPPSHLKLELSLVPEVIPPRAQVQCPLEVDNLRPSRMLQFLTFLTSWMLRMQGTSEANSRTSFS